MNENELLESDQQPLLLNIGEKYIRDGFDQMTSEWYALINTGNRELDGSVGFEGHEAPARSAITILMAPSERLQKPIGVSLGAKLASQLTTGGLYPP